MTPWLVLDVHYLCHRAFHTTKELSWKGKATGVIFGFLKSVSALKDEFGTDRVAFCFEDPRSFRRELYPPYKRKRHTQERTEEEQQTYRGLAMQISELHYSYLPKIGFENVFSQDGMESDDIMAALGQGHLDKEFILVTGDSDLLQCLSPTVSIFSPAARKIITEETFRAAYGIAPRRWAVVKAIAGCHTDEVEGVGGIGEATALKYLRGELPPSSAVFKRLFSRESRAIVRRNRQLVQLPFQGCLVPPLTQDHVNVNGWQEVCRLLGMRSLAGRPPIATHNTTRPRPPRETPSLSEDGPVYN